jgi:hypothetical protein
MCQVKTERTEQILRLLQAKSTVLTLKKRFQTERVLLLAINIFLLVFHRVLIALF